MLQALHFSRVPALVLFAGGVTACLIAVLALRMMAIYWQGQMTNASHRRMAHLVRPRLDLYGIAIWCVVYVLGGVAALWGLWALDG